ncbi:MAG: 2-nitropropane dioxygenase [Elusimicrobia bacterium RIFOXYD2_FULL_34_15]|nr:MAG: 2-nitropropane dioxygenase [Elusimicrobia bacterium RIFOXYD2_FULL_34_15]
MKKNTLPDFKIGDLTAKIPIIQGGMGVGISLSGLAAAVANEGGIGVIATPGIGMFEPNYIADYLDSNIRALRKEIRKARELSKGIIGVNIMCALTDYAAMVRTAVEENIDIVFSGAGLPLNLPEYLIKGAKTKLVPIISSARAAGIIIKRWKEKYNYIPDAIVVEGPLAGGHLGFSLEHIDAPEFRLEALIPEVLKIVKTYEEKYNASIPVIAAGGIYTGADIYKFLKMGAKAVQMATRFVTTDECDAYLEFKQAYINCKKEDIVIIQSPVGMPGRAIKNQFISDILKGSKKPFKCPYHCIITCDVVNSPYCIAMVLSNAKKGEFESGFAFCGANAYMATEIISVKELVNRIATEYDNAVSGIPAE